MARRSKSASPPLPSGLEGPQRLQRVLAAAGFGSRRQCEELIEAGRLHVDGVMMEKLGVVVDPNEVKILVDGQPLKRQKLVYFAVNKPVGVVTTNADPQGRPRVIDLVRPNERVFPVGRLDLSSEGLILLTNDGELAQHLAHPKYGIQKVYRVTVAGKVDSQALRKMREGIYIAEGHVSVDGAKVLKAKARSTEMEITLREGKNREIRRILARLGHKVQMLRRIGIGTLRLGEMPPGAYRPLSREEVRKLQAAAAAPVQKREKPEGEESEAASASKRSTAKSGFSKSTRSASSAPRPSRPSSSSRSTSSSRSASTPPNRTKSSASKSASHSAPAQAGAGEPRAPRKKSPVAAVRVPKSGEFTIRVNRENVAGAVIGGDPRPKPTKQKPTKSKPSKSTSAKPDRKPAGKRAAAVTAKKDTRSTPRTGKKSATSSRPKTTKKRKR